MLLDVLGVAYLPNLLEQVQSCSESPEFSLWRLRAGLHFERIFRSFKEDIMSTIDKTNSIRRALAAKAENGNTSFIHKEDVIKFGGNVNLWLHYDRILTEMEVIAREFVEYYYMVLDGEDSSEIDKKALKRNKKLANINSRLIDKKKELLEWIDPEKKYRCSDFDGIVIGEMAHKIERQKNNVDGETGFKSRAAHTYAERRYFRHRLEAHMGILISGVEVMDAERAHYLRKERDLLRGVRSAEQKQNEIRNNRAKFIAIAVEFEIDEEKRAKREAEFDQQILDLEEDIEEAKEALAKFHREHKDQRMTEPTIQEEMGQAKKEESLSAILEKVKGMTDEQKLEVMKLFGMKSRKSEKVEDLNKRLAETIMSAKDVINKPADEPEKAVAEAK